MTQILVMEKVPGDGFAATNNNPSIVIAVGSGDIAKAQAVVAAIAAGVNAVSGDPALANATQVSSYVGTTAPTVGQAVHPADGVYR